MAEIDPASLSAAERTALHGQLFHAWVRALPSVMEQLGSTPEQLAARERQAEDLAEQITFLRSVQEDGSGLSAR